MSDTRARCYKEMYTRGYTCIYCPISEELVVAMEEFESWRHPLSLAYIAGPDFMYLMLQSHRDDEKYQEMPLNQILDKRVLIELRQFCQERGHGIAFDELAKYV